MTHEFYANDYARYAAALEARGPSGLGPLRRSAIARFEALGGVPTTKQEEYKYTSLRALSRTPFVPVVTPTSVAEVAAGLERHGLTAPVGSRLVLVDGHYAASLSTITSLPEGVAVRSLREALARNGEAVLAHLSATLEREPYPFAALNTAFAADGVSVHIPRGVKVVEPIEVVYVATGAISRSASHTRSLVRVDESADVTLVEHFVALTEAAYLTNTVLEVEIGENAFFDHYRFQNEAESAFHISLLRLRQARSSNVMTHNFSFGGGLVRNDVHGMLDGEGIECVLNGLYLGRGSQHIDNHTTLDHTQPHGHSYEMYKGVLDDQATAVFNGKIFVRKAAQKTDAKQSNKNLLLSPGAQVNTKPQLEIWADDVRCTHGATIGQLDSEALFYLHTRGLSKEVARSVLTYAFANEVIENVRLPALQEALEHELAAWLPRTAELEAAR